MRTTPSALRALARLALVFVACACAQDRTVTAPRQASAARTDQSIDPAVEVPALIDSIFAGGNRTAAHARWSNVVRQLATDPPVSLKDGSTAPSVPARQQLVNLVGWVKEHAVGLPDLPSGEPAPSAARRLAAYMTFYVYALGQPIVVPELTPSTDVAVGIVPTNDTATVVTPQLKAGVQFDAGSVNEPTVVVVSENTDAEAAYTAECSGPLPTSLCQYQRFYRFDEFPHVALNRPAHFVVCGPPEQRGPLTKSDDRHERLRLAHEKPADPADYVPGGTVVGGIEILPLTPNPTTDEFWDCERTGSADRGWLGRALAAVGRALTPRSAYAYDQGVEHDSQFFSDFNVVDPDGAPDVALSSGQSLVSPWQVGPGDPVMVGSFAATNVGLATSGAVKLGFYLSTDSTFSTASRSLGGAGAVPSLAPGEKATFDSVYAYLPADLSPGLYYLGVVADPGAVASDANRANNYVSAAVSMPWNSFRDFSGVSNPAGAWSYGWSDTLGSALNVYTGRATGAEPSGATAVTWYDPSIPDPLFIPSVAQHPDQGILTVHPGRRNGELTVVRWTAPAGGLYVVTAQFTALDPNGDTNAHVMLDGDKLALDAASLNGAAGYSHSYTQTLTLGAGETLDFVVGPNQPGASFDTVGLTVSIRPYPNVPQ